MLRNNKYCSYCGRLSRRCACHQANSDLQRFLARGGKCYAPSWRDAPYKRAVPPQGKSRERKTLQRHYKAWYGELAAEQGESCVNCGESDKLVLDHVIPIAKGGLVAVRQPAIALLNLQPHQRQAGDRLPLIHTSRMKRASGLSRVNVASLIRALWSVCGAFWRRVK